MYRNYKFTTEDIIWINEKRLKKQNDLITFDDYIEWKKLLEQRLKIFEEKHFLCPNDALK